MEKAQQFEGIKAAERGSRNGIGEITAQVMVKYMVIVVYIVPCQHASVNITHKAAQRLVVRQQPAVAALFDNGIANIAQHLGNGF